MSKTEKEREREREREGGRERRERRKRGREEREGKRERGAVGDSKSGVKVRKTFGRTNHPLPLVPTQFQPTTSVSS